MYAFNNYLQFFHNYSFQINLNTSLSVKKFYEAQSSLLSFTFLRTLMASMSKKSTLDANPDSLSFATPEMWIEFFPQKQEKKMQPILFR